MLRSLEMEFSNEEKAGHPVYVERSEYLTPLRIALASVENALEVLAKAKQRMLR
jgi:hypothetical protein